MLEPNLTAEVVAQANQAYETGDLQKALHLYREAADQYALLEDSVNQAQMQNNQSVVLLRVGDARQALAVVQGTDEIFAKAGNTHAQAMAIGNEAAALQACGDNQMAARRYQESADLFQSIGENEYRHHVMQSLSALQLKTGKQFEAMASMQIALNAKKRLSLKDRFLKRLLKIPFEMIKKF